MSMNIYKHVVDYIRDYDDQFAPVGATPDEIRSLRSLAGRPLPPNYEDFLVVFGRSMDWLRVDGFDLKIDTVMAFYRQNPWMGQTPYVRIGNASRIPLEHPHLRHVPLSAEYPSVYGVPDYSGQEDFDRKLILATPLYGAMDEMLCMPVFEQYELRKDARQPTTFRAQEAIEGGLDRVQALLERLGLDLLFFSSSTGRAFKNEETAVKAVQTYLAPIEVTVSSDKPLIQQGFVELLQKELQLQPT
jgi:hypothetical protein